MADAAYDALLFLFVGVYCLHSSLRFKDNSLAVSEANPKKTMFIVRCFCGIQQMPLELYLFFGYSLLRLFGQWQNAVSVPK
jgi:hypothetical protein